MLHHQPLSRTSFLAGAAALATTPAAIAQTPPATPHLSVGASAIDAAMGEREGTRISLNIEASELQMSSDQAVPLSLIVTEAVSNALKYAFPNGRSGTVEVCLTGSADEAELTISDDGVGIPAGRAETEMGVRDGLGLTLIRGFARQLGATLNVKEDHGTTYSLVLPLRREEELAEV